MSGQTMMSHTFRQHATPRIPAALACETAGLAARWLCRGYELATRIELTAARRAYGQDRAEARPGGKR
jgi:hypothetical protein